MSGQMGQGPPGVMAFGKTRARVHMEPDTGVTFKDVAGIDEAVEELQEIVEFLKTPEKFRRLGGRIPKGVLLVGPPGTGKTLLARAIAGEAGVPFFSLSGSEFVEMFVGVGAARVRDLFAQAHAKAPCIIFIDELDAIGKSAQLGHGRRPRRARADAEPAPRRDGRLRRARRASSSWRRPTARRSSTRALMRPGRFDRQVLVDRPDKRGREQILEHPRAQREARAGRGPQGRRRAHAGLRGRGPGQRGERGGAARRAPQPRRRCTRAEFEEAIERVVAGLEKKSRRMNEREKEIVAHHEAGHAVVSLDAALRRAGCTKVSIIPRGLAALGYTMPAAARGPLPHVRCERAARQDGRA